MVELHVGAFVWPGFWAASAGGLTVAGRDGAGGGRMEFLHPGQKQALLHQLAMLGETSRQAALSFCNRDELIDRASRASVVVAGAEVIGQINAGARLDPSSDPKVKLLASAKQNEEAGIAMVKAIHQRATELLALITPGANG